MTRDIDIEFGHTYRDRYTGFEGAAVAVYFYEFSCPRVSLKKMGKEGTILEAVFDAPGLQHVAAVPRVANGQVLGFA